MSIINEISQIRAVSTINISNDLESWQPYIDEAIETFIKPVIGSEFYDSIDEYSASSSGEDLTLELIENIRKPLILYALYLGADEMAVSISGQGIQVVETESHKTAPQYRIQNLKESWIRRAHTWMDVLLAFLETNKDTFTDYVSLENELFIRNAAEFNEHLDIRGSRRVYIALKPVIRSIEKKYIRPTLSPDYYDELKEAMQGSTDLSSDDQAIMDLIRPALAHLTMARALQDISIDILDWGIFDNTGNTWNNIQGKQAANQERISAMLKANQQDGEAELKELQEYLDNNASESKYSTYYASDRYVGSDTAVTRSDYENTIDKPTFVA